MLSRACRLSSMFQAAEGTAGKREAERALFPIGMEIRLVGFGRNRTEAHLPAEIVRPVHAVCLRWLAGNGGADHRIAADERGQLRLDPCPRYPWAVSGITR